LAAFLIIEIAAVDDPEVYARYRRPFLPLSLLRAVRTLFAAEISKCWKEIGVPIAWSLSVSIPRMKPADGGIVRVMPN